MAHHHQICGRASPDRQLSGTRAQFASIINGLAHKDVCRIREWNGLTAAELDARIERINRWAAANAEKTPVQLEWDALEKEIAAKEDWRGISQRVESLLRAKDTRVFGLMQRTLEAAGTSDDDRVRILDLYRTYDVKRAKELAIPLLSAKDASLRFSAAMIAWETGEKSKVRSILGMAVEEGNAWHTAAEALLADNTAESRKELARLTRNPGLTGSDGPYRAQLLARCAAAGLKEPYVYYLEMLQVEGERISIRGKDGKEVNGISFAAPVAEVFSAEITERFASDNATVKDLVKRFPAVKDQVPHLKKWLQGRIDAKD